VNADCGYRDKADAAINARNNMCNRSLYTVNVQDMLHCINKLKLKKAAGADGIMSEHIIYGGQSVLVHLCILFNAMISHILYLIVLVFEASKWQGQALKCQGQGLTSLESHTEARMAVGS